MNNDNEIPLDRTHRSRPRPAPPRWGRRTARSVGSRHEVHHPDWWGPGAEPYPGATILLDLDRVGSDPAAARAVVARFTALQIMLQTDAGLIDRRELESELPMALGYLEDEEPFRPGEREALSAILTATPDLAEKRASPSLAAALLDAGHAAKGWGHEAGARACYLTASSLARREGWLAEEADAAAALDDLDSADLSPRLPPHRQERG